MDGSDILDIWTSGYNSWLVNVSYIAGTSEYLWYVTVI